MGSVDAVKIGSRVHKRPKRKGWRREICIEVRFKRPREEEECRAAARRQVHSDSQSVVGDGLEQERAVAGKNVGYIAC